MKNFLFLFVIAFFSSLTLAQKSEDYIPKDAVTVFSINNVSLLQKVSMDKLVQYEFMAEVQQELFDGSTNGKTIKESGIDFDQKLNVYYGVGSQYEVAGFTFGIKDQDALFTVFDDFKEEGSPIEGVQFYSSYFNHLMIKDNIGVLLRVDPVDALINTMADSVWMVNGGGRKYVYSSENAEEFNEDVFDVEEEINVLEEGDFPLEENLEEISGRKNYNEIMDSIRGVLKERFFLQIGVELFISGKNLKKQDPDLAELLTHSSEGVFYLDNGRNFKKSEGFWYFESLFPQMLSNVQDLYSGNKIMGDLRLNNNAITASLNAYYGEALGSIYAELNNAKFDKKVLNYIHKDNSAYFTYNINLRKAYEEAFEVLMPMLREEKNPRIAGNVLAVDLLNEFVDKDALFGTYRGSMFGTFNGIKKVNISKIVFEYDEDFNYTEKRVQSEEEMPLFTVGFSTKRNDIPEKVLKHIARITSECKKVGDVWKINEAIFSSIPLYVINKNDLFILTNDEELALNHSDGYGSDKLGRKQAKESKQSGFVYANIDWSKTIAELPREIFSSQQVKLLDAMSGKTGNLILTSSKTTKTETNYEIKYTFNTEYDDPGEHVLDLVNSLFLLMK
jgi:hypothetical protein